MKCPKCQRENTLKRAENNAAVCAACGSRFRLKSPESSATPQAPPTVPQRPSQTPPQVAANEPLRSPNAPNSRSFNPKPSVDDEPKENQGSKNAIIQRTFAFFTWTGRATSKEFLTAFAYYLGALFALCVLSALIFPMFQLWENNEFLFSVTAFVWIGGGVVFSFSFLVLNLMLLASAARRLRDAGFSPWLTLLYLAPPIAPLLTLALALLPSSEKNQTSAARENTTSPSLWRQIFAISFWRRMFSTKEPLADFDWPFAVGLYVATLFLPICFYCYIQLTDSAFKDTVCADILYEHFSETWTGYKIQKYARPFVYSTFAVANAISFASLVITATKKTSK